MEAVAVNEQSSFYAGRKHLFHTVVYTDRNAYHFIRIYFNCVVTFYIDLDLSVWNLIILWMFWEGICCCHLFLCIFTAKSSPTETRVPESQTWAVIRDLHPSTAYSFQVLAVNDVGASGASSTVHADTQEEGEWQYIMIIYGKNQMARLKYGLDTLKEFLLVHTINILNFRAPIN